MSLSLSVSNPRIIIEDRSLHPFLFMGCWNKEGPERDAVLKAIRKDPTPLLILGGDNAYPQKDKKNPKKTAFILEHVMSGLDGLPKDRPVFATIGNHNMDRHPVKSMNSISNKDNKDNKNNKNNKDETNALKIPPIFDLEKSYPGWNLPYTYYCILFKDKYALIFLNTNFFDTHSERTKNIMLGWLEDTLTKIKGTYSYYIIQHEPLFAITSPKKEDGNPRTAHLTDGEAILDVMLKTDCFPDIIFCADTHNYQEWDLLYRGHAFHQIVVGTGGAKPNFVSGLQTLPFNTSYTKADDVFEGTKLLADTLFTSIVFKSPKNKKQRIPSYGYYRITNEISRSFIPVIHFFSEHLEGGAVFTNTRKNGHFNRQKTRRQR